MNQPLACTQNSKNMLCSFFSFSLSECIFELSSYAFQSKSAGAFPLIHYLSSPLDDVVLCRNTHKLSLLNRLTSSRHTACAASWSISSSPTFRLPRLYSTGCIRYKPFLLGSGIPSSLRMNSTTSQRPYIRSSFDRTGRSRVTRTLPLDSVCNP